MGTGMTYDHAVALTYRVINFLNSKDGTYISDYMAKKFGLTEKEEWTLYITGVDRNCTECSGCHSGECTLGCYIEGIDKICYWDKGLTDYIGQKLIIHEIGHVLYRQAYVVELPPEEDFKRSEAFAQYFEAHFNVDMQFLADSTPTTSVVNTIIPRNNSTVHKEIVVDFNPEQKLLVSVGLVLAGIGGIYLLSKRKK